MISDRKAIKAMPNTSLNAYISKKAVFIHIPKTAGISLIKSIYGENIDIGGHRKLTYLKKLMPGDFNDYFVFTIVRNPWDRLYSAFKFMMKGGINIHDENAYNIHLSEIKTFEEFVLQWLNEENIQHIIHFYPQSWFLKNKEGEIEIDFIGKFETLQSDFAEIADRMNVKTKLKHLNKGDGKPYKGVYTDKMIEKVRDLYHEDIELFNYSF